MSATIKTWYDFVLQQMAAESYLDQQATTQDGLIGVLEFGSNNPTYQGGKAPTTATLSGATRLTVDQAIDFTNRYKIISHLPNTASGFSATLMRDVNTGAYTLSMRSTEYFDSTQGGDWARDGLPGADGEIGRTGFAFGQIASMESYYDHLKLGERYDADSNQWISDPALNDFKNRFGASGAGGVLNVTGYSLSGQLADVFKQLHPEVTQACVFNPTGMGNIGQGNLEAMVIALRAQLASAGLDLSYPSSGNIYGSAVYQNIVDSLKASYQTSYDRFSGNTISLSNVTQLYGQGAHNDTEYVANAGNHAPATKIFIEDQPDIQGFGPISWLDSLTGTSSDYGTTHSITLLADSLAVMSVFEKLGLDMSTSAGLDSAYNILAATSNQRGIGLLGTGGTAEGNSLEKAVQGLGKLLLGDAGLASVLNLNGSTEIPYGQSGGSGPKKLDSVLSDHLA